MSKRTRLLLAAMILFGQVVGALAVPTPAAAQYSYAVTFDVGGRPYAIGTGTLTDGVNVGNRPDMGQVLAGRVPTGATCDSSNNALASVEGYFPALTAQSITVSVYGVVAGSVPKFNYYIRATDSGGQTLYEKTGSDFATGWRTIITGNIFGNFDPPLVGVANIYVSVQSCTDTNDRVGIGSITVNSSTPPAATGTPAPTVTPTIIFIGPVYCTIPTQAAATFSDLGLWRLTGGAARPAGAASGVSLPPGASASLATRLSLSPSQRYAITARYRATTPTTDQFWTVGLGGNVALPVLIANQTGQQTINLPAANYPPSAGGGYDLTLAYGGTNVGLVIDYVCITQTTSSGGGVVGFTPETCERCLYAPVGDLVQDVPALFNWLWCALRRLLECQFLILITGIYRFLGDVVLIMVSTVKWVMDSVMAGAGWMGSNITALAYYLGGSLDNTISVGVITVSGGATIWDALIALFNGLRDTIVSVVNDLREVVLQLFGLIGGVLDAVATLLLEIVRGVFKILATAIEAIFSIVPEMFTVFQDSFNAGMGGEANPLSPPPDVQGPPELPTFDNIFTCNNAPDSDFIYALCLANFILSNTLFNGINYLLIVVATGLFGLYTLFSVVQKVKKAFSA